MKIQLLAFGQIAEITGKSNWEMTEIKDTVTLVENLEKQFPSLVKIKYSIAINRKLIQGNTILKTEDTIALLPPFSGG